jgi:hypothetical protein
MFQAPAWLELVHKLVHKNSTQVFFVGATPVVFDLVQE